VDPRPDPTGSAAVGQGAAQLAAFTRIAEALATAPDPTAFLDRAAREIAAAVSADVVVFFALDPERRSMRIVHLLGGDYETWRHADSMPLEGTSVGEAVTRGVASVRQEGEFTPHNRENLAHLGARTIASVPIRFQAEVVAVLTVMFRTPRHREACRLELLEALGAQVAAAIRTHRLVDDQRRRVSELSLLNDIAAASTSLEPAALVERAVHRIAETVAADAGAAYLLDGNELVQAASVGVDPLHARHFARLPVTENVARAMGSRVAVPLPDLPPTSWMRANEGLRSAAIVPLLTRERSVGVFLFGRRRQAPFGHPELELLTAVGVQIGTVFESARHLAGTRRRAADLEAVNALALRLLGEAAGGAPALLENISRDFARALSARAAAVLRLDDATQQLSGLAAWGSPRPAQELVLPLARSALARRALESRLPVTGTALVDGPPQAGDPPPLSFLLVPFVTGRATRGLVVVADAPGRRFGDAERALATALASAAALGLENAALHAAERQRVEDLSLLNEVGRAVTGTLDLDRILKEGARAAVRLVEGSIARVMLLQPDGSLCFRASTAEEPGLSDLFIPADYPSLITLALRERRPLTAEDALTDPRTNQEQAARYRTRGYVVVPLVLRDRALGTLLVVQSDRPRRFTPAEVDRLVGVANHLAIAIENSRLYDDLRRSYAELASAQDRLVAQARLAALGELSAIVAHEVRNPLGVIFNSLGALRRMVPQRAEARELLAMVGEEADRLNRIVADLLDFARPATPTFRPEQLERVVEEAVAAALAEGAPGVEVVRSAAPDLPPVPMDARLVHQALLNVVLNAVQAMPEGGRVTVRVRVEDGAAVVEVGDTGPGLTEEARARLFQPFFTTKPTGTGLGLAVVKRIVDDHRGQVVVRDAPSGGTVFALRLPLAGDHRESLELRGPAGGGSRP
jgi:signal transduction histidine kinase